MIPSYREIIYVYARNIDVQQLTHKQLKLDHILHSNIMLPNTPNSSNVLVKNSRSLLIEKTTLEMQWLTLKLMITTSIYFVPLWNLIIYYVILKATCFSILFLSVMNYNIRSIRFFFPTIESQPMLLYMSTLEIEIERTCYFHDTKEN